MFTQKERQRIKQLSPEQQKLAARIEKLFETPWFCLIAGTIFGAVGVVVGLWIASVL